MQKNFRFSEAQAGLVFGAGRGIGLGIVKALIEKTDVKVHAVYRNGERSSGLFEYHKAHSNRLELHLCDPNSEESLVEVSKKLDKIDFIINSVGLLHDDKKQIKPERKIEDCEVNNLMELYQVNTLISVLIYKVFKNFIKKRRPTLFSSVSAKVGSIAENGLGGWYGYRMSKAALNMFLKNAAIESARRASNVSVVSIHPGTTVTDLSKPFIEKTNYKLHSPEEAGVNIINVLDDTLTGKEAHFLSWDGKTISW
jgi:NAD(P)-dependent dehydrogenase (short-subunit alcohol dehydrogenase family)